MHPVVARIKTPDRTSDRATLASCIRAFEDEHGRDTLLVGSPAELTEFRLELGAPLPIFTFFELARMIEGVEDRGSFGNIQPRLFLGPST